MLTEAAIWQDRRFSRGIEESHDVTLAFRSTTGEELGACNAVEPEDANAGFTVLIECGRFTIPFA